MGRIMRVALATIGRRSASLRRDASGLAAVEFGMIGFPLFMLLAAVFEAGLTILAQQSLDNGVDRASRQVFTGVFQSNADSTPAAQRFKTALCTGLIYIDCAKVLVEVTTAATFSASAPSNPYNAATRTANPSFGTVFQCPAANNIVTVRAAARVPRYFGFLTLAGQQLAAGGQMVISTQVFRAEPYPTGAC